eukprot:SAG11_NODE_2650_length_3125_cov_4.827495_4_plen_185_part_00
MIMSEYDYDIKWIKGSTNHVGDTLSRLINIPEDDWNNLEVDDDTVHPFLMGWADYVRLQPVGIQQLLVAGERAVVHKCCTCGEGFPSRNKLFKHLGQHSECLRSKHCVASMQSESTGNFHTKPSKCSTGGEKLTEKTRNLHIVTGAGENSENIDESNMQTSGQAGSISKTVSKQRENTIGCTHT